MKNTLLRAIIPMGALFLFSGCQRSHEQTVAQVGDTAITLSDFTSRLQATPAAYQQYTATSEGRRQFLNLLVREKVLLSESRKAGFTKEENYKKAVDRFKKKLDRDYKDYQESLLIEMYLARLRAKELAVTDEDVRKYYDDHASEYAHPVEIQASHILVSTPEKAEEVLARLKKGEKFEDLARAVSMDPGTAVNGGKLNPFVKGTMVPEFENGVAPLKVGEVSGAVKTHFGYHIIKKTGEKVLPSRPLDGFVTILVEGKKQPEAVKDLIRNKIQREKFDQWVAKTQSSIGVHIDEKVLASVSTTPPATTEPLSKGSAQ